MKIRYLPELGFQIIESVLFVGSSKDGKNESWREKDIRFHLLKGISHYTRALQLLDNHITDDETVSDHIDRGMTRGAMARAGLIEN
jgi:hypothetical protein